MADFDIRHHELIIAAASALKIKVAKAEKEPNTRAARERIREELVMGHYEAEQAISSVDDLLQLELTQRTLVNAMELPKSAADPRLSIWRGDVCSLQIGAIVNAANEGGLGCFQPDHRCIDNVIHCAAGPALRNACKKGLQDPRFAGKLPTGKAFTTAGFNMPADFVIHTPGPVGEKPELLAQCYRSVLNECKANRIRSVAFCCISTGLFGYPADRAAEVAIATVRQWLDRDAALLALDQMTTDCKTKDSDVPPPPVAVPSLDLVVFNVFLESDLHIYRNLLGPDVSAEQDG